MFSATLFLLISLVLVCATVSGIIYYAFRSQHAQQAGTKGTSALPKIVPVALRPLTIPLRILPNVDVAPRDAVWFRFAGRTAFGHIAGRRGSKVRITDVAVMGSERKLVPLPIEVVRPTSRLKVAPHALRRAAA